MKTTKIFAPIFKVDAVQGLVYARITDETVDLANEIMDYDSSKPLFQKWSGHAEKVSGGKSKGNLRAMHGPTAAGKLVDIAYDDTAKSIECVSKVVDAGELEKCIEGVYTGLSLGGNIVGKMWKDEPTGAMRYTVQPIEVSLVDLPCNPNATFEMIKVAGQAATAVAFKVWTPSNKEIAAQAEEIAKAAGKPEAFGDYFEEARTALIDAHTADAVAAEKAIPVEGEPAPDAEPEAEAEPTPEEAPAETIPAAEPVPADPPEDTAKAAPFALEQVQLWKCSDGKTFAKKSDAKKHQDAIDLIAGAGGPLADAIAKASLAAETGAEAEAIPAADIKALGEQADVLSKALSQIDPALEGKIEKSLYGVAELASALDRVACICSMAMWEAEGEQDDSKVPAMIGDAVSQLGAALVAMAQEEVAEMIANLQDRGLDIVEIVGVDYVELAAAVDIVKAIPQFIEKVGARNSKKDAAKIQATHDHMAELGAKCAMGDADKDAQPEVIKSLTAERDALQDQVEKAVPGIEKLGETITKMKADLEDAQAKIKALEAAPAPMPTLHPTTKVAGKAEDGGGSENVITEDEVQAAALKLIKSMTPEQIQTALFKEATSRPVRLTGMVRG